MLTIDMIGIGEENSVTREELCRRSGLSDSAMRIQLSQLKMTYPICSSCSRVGYFRPRKDRPAEIKMAQDDADERYSKALTMLAQVKTLKDFIKTDQLEFEF